jgi:hypothetical protein
METKIRNGEFRFKDFRPPTRIVLTIVHSAVGNGTWSMLKSRVGRVKPAEFGRDEVCDKRDAGNGCADTLVRRLRSMPEGVEKRNAWVQKVMKMTSTKDASVKIVIAPKIGGRSDLSFDPEEFICLFPNG